MKTLASNNVSSVVLMCLVCWLHLISDLVGDLFMHSLPDVILLYLAASFYTEGVYDRSGSLVGTSRVDATEQPTEYQLCSSSSGVKLLRVQKSIWFK